MRNIHIALIGSIVALLLASCSGGKTDIALSNGQVYQVEPSGRVKVFPSASLPEAKGAQPLHRLRVKRKNEGTGAKTDGCWQCTDCICNGDECACTECTSC